MILCVLDVMMITDETEMVAIKHKTLVSPGGLTDMKREGCLSLCYSVCTRPSSAAEAVP